MKKITLRSFVLLRVVFWGTGLLWLVIHRQNLTLEHSFAYSNIITAYKIRPSSNTPKAHTTHVISIQNNKISFPILSDCTNPYYIVRSFGRNAIMFKRSLKKPSLWISYIPIHGTSIIDVTLIACNAFNSTDGWGYRRETPMPVVLYRKQHYSIAHTNYNHTKFFNTGWERNVNATLKNVVNINTRYQPNTTFCCCTPKIQKNAICSSSAIDSYTYNSNIRNHQSLVNRSICFVGASHAKLLGKYAKQMHMEAYFFRAAYARDVASLVNNVDFLSLFNKCELGVFIHVGQWDLGWPENKLTPIAEYKRHLQDALLKFKQKLKHKRLYVLSNNYNPLAFRILKGMDWRRPDVIDKYNLVSKNIAETLNVSFIDNNYEVGGAAWDSASDWCHYDAKVMRAVLMNTLHHVTKR